MNNPRFSRKVEIAADPAGCWNWTATINADGYGQFGLDGKVEQAHRVSYEERFGKIPAGLEIDHLCRNRRCVRPDHLEAVTHAENVRRGLSPAALHAVKTHCPSGHGYTQENSLLYRGRRYCRACRRKRGAERSGRRAAS